MLLYVSWSLDTKDRSLLDRLRVHLKPLEQDGKVEIWDANMTPAGSDLDREPTSKLLAASLIVPLLSSDYLASKEYERLRSHREQVSSLVPVLLRSCDLEGTLFDSLQLLPEGRHPIATLQDQDGAFVQVVSEIKRRRNQLEQAQDKPGLAWQDELLTGYHGHTAASVRKFLEDYLGTADVPVPFGGRAAELRHFHDWLDDQHAPPYLFLVAPTGTGKSALLCHAVQALSRGGRPTLFLPVSHRYRINQEGTVIQALLGRLAHLHGDKRVDQSTPTWADLAFALRRPQRGGLLVVLDGVDERAGWELRPDLFPREVPAGTRIVISARSGHEIRSVRDLREQLGLSAVQVREMVLRPLDEKGVVEALRGLGPSWAAAAEAGEIARRVYGLCNGDPLVLRLLLDELLAQFRILEPGAPDLARALQGMHAGLRGVWERQLGALERDAFEMTATRALLCLLTCALGPLDREDILRLAPAEIQNPTVLSRVAGPVSRLVLVEGRSYVFCHTRLREVFAEEHMSDVERQRWHGRLLSDGAEVVDELLDGRRLPRAVPEYVLTYYGTHLAEAHAGLPERMALVSGGWMQAWKAGSGGLAGFLEDVRRAWGAARELDEKLTRDGNPPAHLADELRCALCVASARSAAYVPSRLMTLLIERGIWTPAQALARLDHATDFLGDPGDGPSDCLVALAPLLPDELLKQAMELATRCARANRATSIEPWKALLPRLVRILPLETLAARLHSLGQNEWHIMLLLAELARHAPHAAEGLWSECHARARRSGSSYILRELARLDPVHKEGLLKEALDLDRNLPDPRERLAALEHLLGDLPAAQVDEVCGAAIAAALLVQEEDRLHPLLSVLAKCSAATREEGLKRLLTEPCCQAFLGRGYLLMDYPHMSSSIPWHQLPADLLAPVRLAARSQAEQAWQSKRDGVMLVALARRGMAEEAVQWLDDAGAEAPRWAHFLLTGWLSAERRWQLFQEALAEESVFTAKQRLRDVVGFLPDEFLDEACARLQEAEPDVALLGLLAIHERMPGGRRPDVAERALTTARKIRHPQRRAQALCEVLPLCPSQEVLEQIDQAIDAMGDVQQQISMLESLARQLNEPWRSDVLEEALRLVTQMEPGPRLHKLEWIGWPESLEKQAVALYVQTLREHPRLLRRSGWWHSFRSSLESEQDGLLQETALQLERIGGRASLVAAVAALHPGEELLRDLWKIACAEEEPEERFRVLAYLLLPHCKDLPQLHAQVVRYALAAARLAMDSRHVCGVPGFYLQYAEPAERQEALQRHWDRIRSAWERNRDWFQRLRAHPGLDISWEWHDVGTGGGSDDIRIVRDELTTLIPYLSTEMAEQAVELVPWQWSDLIAALLPRLPAETRTRTLAQALAAARAQDPARRGDHLIWLVPHLPEPEQDAGIKEALNAACKTERSGESATDNRSAIAIFLAPHLNVQHLDQAIRLLLDGGVSPNFVSRLSPPLRPQAVHWILDGASALDEQKQRPILGCLIAHVPDERIPAALDEVLQRYDQSTAKEMSRAAPRLSDNGLLRACEAWSRWMAGSRPAHGNVEVLAALGGELLWRSPRHRHRIWSLIDGLLRTPDFGRGDILEAVQRLAPLLLLMGVDPAALARSMLDVVRFWP